jgi:hypothetical protein
MERYNTNNNFSLKKTHHEQLVLLISSSKSASRFSSGSLEENREVKIAPLLNKPSPERLHGTNAIPPTAEICFDR